VITVTTLVDVPQPVLVPALPPAPLEFFRCLYGDIPAGSKFELRAKCPAENVAHSSWATSWAEFTFRGDEGANVWYGATFRLAEATRATLADLSLAFLVWLDADRLEPHRKNELVGALQNFAHPPTVIISSSNAGLQALWRLVRPLDMQDPADVRQLREIVYGLALRFGADATVRVNTEVR